MWEKLGTEFDDFKANRLSTRHALNFALTAWHLSDWLWATDLKVRGTSQIPQLGKEFTGLENFQLHLREKCSDLSIISEICHASKHTRSEGTLVESTARLAIPYGSGAYGESTYGGGLLVVTSNGRERIYFDIVNTVMDYWKGIIDRLN